MHLYSRSGCKYWKLLSNHPYHEKELLQRIAEGDEAAFSTVFHFYYSRLLNFLSRFDADTTKADEAVQETFIKVWLSRDQLPAVDNFQAWLFTIASRKAISLMRKDLVFRKNKELFEKTQTIHAVDTPADMAQFYEIQHLVREAIARMPQGRQRIYRMSREEGLKPAEIALRLDLSVSTVKNSLVTALQEIRDFLKERGHIINMVWAVLLFY